MQIAKLAVSLLIVSAVFATVSPASAETINCTPITSVPFVITAPGVYCLTRSFVTNMSDGYAIDIQANNVVLDLNGHRLGKAGAGLGTLAGGIGAGDRQNVTVRNGTVRGFASAVSLGGHNSYGIVVEDIRADHNTLNGIQVGGVGTIVRNNQVIATGGSTLSSNAFILGIFVSGPGAMVLNNDVIGVVDGGASPSAGIFFEFAHNTLTVNNRITDAEHGIYYNFQTSGSKYRDNLTSDVATPYVGGTDAGNNN